MFNSELVIPFHLEVIVATPAAEVAVQGAAKTPLIASLILPAMIVGVSPIATE